MTFASYIVFIIHSRQRTVFVTLAYLFDDGVRLSKSLDIINVAAVICPRPIGARCPQWPEREESEVAVRHAVVLGADQKPRQDRVISVTVDDHCMQQSAYSALHCTIDLCTVQQVRLKYTSS